MVTRSRILVFAIAVVASVFVAGGSPGVAHADPPLPFENPAYASELEAWLAGDGVYAGEADAWISGRVLAGDGASIADYFAAGEAAGVTEGFGAAVRAIAPASLAVAGALVAGYITYKVVQHLRNGHTKTRVFQAPAGALGPAVSGFSPVVHPELSKWKFNSATGFYNFYLTYDVAPPWSANSHNWVNNPDVCDDYEPGCWGLTGLHASDCLPFDQCMYVGPTATVTLAAVAASNAAGWDYLNDDMDLGSMVPYADIGYRSCDLMPTGTCGTKVRQATEHQLGMALQKVALPVSVGTPADFTRTITQPQDPDLDTARAIIGGNTGLRDTIDDSLEEHNPTGTFTLPDCDGLTFAACRDELRAAGLLGTITRTTVAPSECEGSCEGLVIRTDPIAGTDVLPGRAVTVTDEPNPEGHPFPTTFTLLAPIGTETLTRYWQRLMTANPNFRPMPTPFPLESELGSPDDPQTEDDPPCTVQGAYVFVEGETDYYDNLLRVGDANRTIPLDSNTAADAIDLWLNPHDVAGGTEECDTDFTPPGAVPPPPDTPGIDFGPITSLDPGCKFPFGFICYAQQVVAWFTVAPDAPRFDFDITCPSLVPCQSVRFGPVDLNVMDGYAAMLRALFSVVIWVGGVYLVATRLLGFDAGGDPGEAIDDA